MVRVSFESYFLALKFLSSEGSFIKLKKQGKFRLVDQTIKSIATFQVHRPLVHKNITRTNNFAW